MRFDTCCDALWAELLKKPTGEKFEEFYIHSHDQVFAMVKRILHEIEPTEYVVQAVYEDLWEMLVDRAVPICRKHGESQSRALPAKAADALVRLANLEIDRQRTQYNSELERQVDVELAYDLIDPAPRPRECASGHEAIQLIKDALFSIPHEERMIFSLYYFECISQSEIAGQFQLAPSFVKRKLAHARESIFAKLSAQMGYDRPHGCKAHGRLS
jgi:RNA polymerase sigma factor (sigma-70 family)